MQVIVQEYGERDRRSGQMHHLAGCKNWGTKDKGSSRTPVTYWVFVVRFHPFLQNIAFILQAPYLLSPINHKSLSNVQVCNIVQGTRVQSGREMNVVHNPRIFFFSWGTKLPPNFVWVRGWKWEGWGHIKPLPIPIMGAGPSQLRLTLLPSRSFDPCSAVYSPSLPVSV